jgi:nucleoside-diphosphate-sugar epimerase
MDAAVKGTLGILTSALKHGGSRIQRIVVTSTGGTIVGDPGRTQRTFSELDWNDQSVEEVNQKGIAASGMHKYKNSKVLAERGWYHCLIFDKPS